MSARKQYSEEVKGVAAKLKTVELRDAQDKVIVTFAFNTKEGPGHLVQVMGKNGDPPVGEKTTTRYGDLISAKSGVFFRNEKILELQNGDSLKVHSVHKLGDKDVALSSISGNGSGGYSTLALITIGADGRVNVVQNEPGSTLDTLNKSEIKVSRTKDNLILDLGYAEGKKRTGIFDGKTLEQTLTQSGPVPLPAHLCNDLYVALEYCVAAKGSTPACEGVAGAFSNAESGYTREAFKIPGMTEARFDKVCDAACASGERPSYDQLKTTFCDQS